MYMDTLCFRSFVQRLHLLYNATVMPWYHTEPVTVITPSSLLLSIFSTVTLYYALLYCNNREENSQK